MRFKRWLAVGSLIMMLALLTMLAQANPPLPLPDSARTTTELLLNGGFESDLDTNKIPDDWQANGTTNPKADKLKCDQPEKPVAHSGSCAFMFRGNPVGLSSKIQQTVNDFSSLISGTAVTFSVFIDPRSGLTGAKIGKATVAYTDGTKTKLQLSIPDAEGYTQVIDTQVITIPDGASIKKVTVQFKYAASSGKFYLDDASLNITTEDTTPTANSTATIEATATTTVSIEATVTHTSTIEATSTSTDLPTATATSTSIPATATDTPVNTLTSTPTNTSTPTATSTPQPLPVQLFASDPVSHDEFGNAVSLSGDGQTALIGAKGDSINGNFAQGSAYIFTLNGNIWTQQAQLIASDGMGGEFFGWSVSLSSDGNTALIGAPFDKVGDNFDQGSLYIFTRNGNSWSQQAQLIASDGVWGAWFGWSVSLSSDGNTALAGGNNNQLGAYVFTRNNGIWTQQLKLLPDEIEDYSHFGSSVNLSNDGNTAIVSAYSHTLNQNAAYIFTRNGNLWTQQAILSDPNGAVNSSFATSVNLSGDGQTALIGAHGGQMPTWGAYVFTRNGTTWTQQTILTIDRDIVNGWEDTGFSFTLNNEGDTAVIGAYWDGTNEFSYNFQGAVHIFTLDNNVWSLTDTITAADGMENDRFGISASLNDAEDTLLVGASGDNDFEGSAWIIPLP